MNNITNGRFMTIIKSDNQIDLTELESAYNELAKQLAYAVDNVSNLLSLCRLLNALSIDLETIIEKWRYQKKAVNLHSF